MEAVTILSHNTFWFQGAFSTIFLRAGRGSQTMCAIYKEIKADVILQIQSRM